MLVYTGAVLAKLAIMLGMTMTMRFPENMHYSSCVLFQNRPQRYKKTVSYYSDTAIEQQKIGWLDLCLDIPEDEVARISRTTALKTITKF